MKQHSIDKPTNAPPSRDLSAAFHARRKRLVRIAYGITGSLAEAEDCVQEAWLRLERAIQREQINDLAAWLTTVVSRLALDALGRAQVRREEYVGVWLPEPLVELLGSVEPPSQNEMDQSISMALLIALERLSSAERTAFLLHDVFDVPFDEISQLLHKSAEAVRQLASRARAQLRHDRPRFAPNTEEQARIVTAFAEACQGGDLQQLIRLLHPEIAWRADTGGKVRSVVDMLEGANAVAGVLATAFRRAPQNMRRALVNGNAGFILRDADGVLTVVAFTFENDLIASIDVMRNPEKLGAAEQLL